MRRSEERNEDGERFVPSMATFDLAALILAELTNCLNA